MLSSSRADAFDLLRVRVTCCVGLFLLYDRAAKRIPGQGEQTNAVKLHLRAASSLPVCLRVTACASCCPACVRPVICLTANDLPLCAYNEGTL